MDENKIIREAYKDLVKSLRHGTTDEKKKLIRKAFEYANVAHKGVVRKSGEPYITHPIAVAKICAKEIGLGTTSIVSAMLHDVVEDTDYTIEDIRIDFGEKIANIVAGLTKISGLMNNDTNLQAENFKKIILTLAEDVRVILIKIADRLHNMRTLDSLAEYKQIRISSETLYIYAPLAHRMGLYKIKSELEDLSLKYEQPQEYKFINEKIEGYKHQFSDLLEKFTAPIKEKLNINNYTYNVTARTKSVYSVWRKMKVKNLKFDEIYDLLAIRIVFKPKVTMSEKLQCWNIYSIITDLYSPKPERIRDWLSVPKATGYEALHLTVMGPEGHWFEVQIRSERMNELAEKGLAAHWKYKEHETDSSEIDKWLSGIKDMLDQPDSSAIQFMDEFKLNLYAKEIRVFTPKGEMITLAKGATALDFAYEINTEIGNKCIGAKINHKLVPMSQILMSGDQVEILTSDKQKPQKEWIDFIATAKARTKIHQEFAKERKKDVQKGKDIFARVLKKLNLTETQKQLEKAIKGVNIKNTEDFYMEISKNSITETDIKKILTKKEKSSFIKYWHLQFLMGHKDENKKKLKGKEDSKFIIAECCKPIPGDNVVGLKLEDNKIFVHKKSCPEAIKLMSNYGDKIVQIKWVTQNVMSYLVNIKVNGINIPGVVSEVTGMIAKENKISMKTIHFENKDGIFEGILSLYINNANDLMTLLANIAKINGIKNVRRIDNENY